MVAFTSSLTQAKLQKRYKRFLADVVLSDGTLITVHCPNTGAMTGCKDPNSKVYLSRSDNPKRKYQYTWEYASDVIGNKICINAANANKVVAEALMRNKIEGLAHYNKVMPEQKINSSRIDFLLLEPGYPDCYVEVKSATLAENNLAMFPDTITTRGQKHCYELAELSQKGFRAILLFCVMREGITQFKIAQDIDPDYAKALSYAIENGVEVLCYGCNMDLENIQLSKAININY